MLMNGKNYRDLILVRLAEIILNSQLNIVGLYLIHFYKQELIPYKCKAEERIRVNTFYPSFAKLIIDFDAVIKCQGYFTFRKKTVAGLCSLCSFYISMSWQERLLNKNYISINEKKNLNFDEMVILAAQLIFGYNQLREG